jgi:hypothetical protein
MVYRRRTIRAVHYERAIFVVSRFGTSKLSDAAWDEPTERSV